MHCSQCHHEWEGQKGDICDWCEGNSYVLNDKTGFKMLTDQIFGDPIEDEEETNYNE